MDTDAAREWKVAANKLRRLLRDSGQRLVIGRGADPAMMIVDRGGRVVAGPVITNHLRWLREWTEDGKWQPAPAAAPAGRIGEAP